jgi:hypothetical protein
MPETHSESTALVLGAGFSHCAGVPLQREFSQRLFDPVFSSEIDKAITSVLKGFIEEVFGWKEGHSWPTLEDIFTCIDLSAASGHHLGIKYTPKLLRAIRRMAIYRVFSVLDLKFHNSPDIHDFLGHYVNGARPMSGIVILNWDIVLEKHLSHLDPRVGVNYCCHASPWRNPFNGLQYTLPEKRVNVFKVHGSSNWVYCENCTGIFYDLNEKLSLRSKVGLIKHDFRLFETKFTGKTFSEALGINPDARKCQRCKNMVSSHIATFSYRKSFRTHAFAETWHGAADALADAAHWVFVGYSLPKADFEFKHMLKTAELRFAHLANRPKKRISVISKGEEARSEFESFFGTDRLTYFSDGLEGYVADVRSKICVI